MKVKTVLFDKIAKNALNFASREDLQLDLEHFFTYDVYLYMAHNIMQCSEGYLKPKELVKILEGLKAILDRYPALMKKDFLKEGVEDVHMLIELLLEKKIGKTGLKARFNLSRNDEVASLQQMLLRDSIISVALLALRLCKTLIEKARKEKDVVMPAFTHLQPAQPTTMGYYWLSKVDQILRDVDELKCLFKQVNASPLGACAISGAPRIDGIGIDREMTSKLLGFDGLIENTIDAVSSRGEVGLRFLYVLNTLVSLHLSGMCEDLIVWSSLGMVTWEGGYASGSSYMPQKVSPDTAELVRAKAGKMLGNLTRIATICKALPMGYNRDLQEVKPVLIDSIDSAALVLGVVNGMVKDVKPNDRKMAEILESGWCTASDLANAISIKFGLPYRKAYHIVKKVSKGDSLEDASKEVVGKRIMMTKEEMIELLDPRKSVKRRDFIGGPSPSEVMKASLKRKKSVSELDKWFKEKAGNIRETFSKLEKISSKIVRNRTFDEEFVKYLKGGGEKRVDKIGMP